MRGCRIGIRRVQRRFEENGIPFFQPGKIVGTLQKNITDT
jgi:hypothetical protein